MRTRKTAALVICISMCLSVSQADFMFSRPVNLGASINSSSGEWCPSISADGLTLFFSRQGGGLGPEDIYMATRATTSDPWGPAVNIGSPVNDSNWQQGPSLSADGLTLFFNSDWSTGYGASDLWMTTRDTEDSQWDSPVNLGSTINTSSEEWLPSISADGLTLTFTSDRPGGLGGWDLWVTTRATIQDEWTPPVNLGAPINSSNREVSMSISHDDLILFFSSDRPGGYGGYDLWMSRRGTVEDPWSTPVNLGPNVNSTVMYEQSPDISSDNSMLFYTGERPGDYGGGDLFQVSIMPVVDFTGDNKVDIEDLTTLIEHWGQNEPAFDMGPMPWGDGIVDAADLEVLMSHWGQEVYDPHLLAHWKLDEAEGMFAYDSAGENDGIVLGNPVWQPEGGQVSGALEFDGIDDVIIVDSVLNPEDGPFSVFAWVKDGAPGQTILSQQTGVNWLQADSDGMLMTELTKSGGRTPNVALYSETVITDGNWHRIGFVWDGSQRTLYVDDTLVALDAQSNLAGSAGGLYIGTGKGSEPGTFWSGMIDDVWVYDRVVTP